MRIKSAVVASATVIVIAVFVAIWWGLDLFRFTDAVAEEAGRNFHESKAQMVAFGFRGVIMNKGLLDGQNDEHNAFYLTLKLDSISNAPYRRSYFDRFSFSENEILRVRVTKELFDASNVGDTLSKGAGQYHVSKDIEDFPLLSRKASVWLP